MENPTASVKMSEVENALCGVKKATWSLRHLGCFTDSFTALDWLPWGWADLRDVRLQKKMKIYGFPWEMIYAQNTLSWEGIGLKLHLGCCGDQKSLVSYPSIGTISHGEQASSLGILAGDGIPKLCENKRRFHLPDQGSRKKDIMWWKRWLIRMGILMNNICYHCL